MSNHSMSHIINCGKTPIPVLAAGSGWLAVDKPAGMSVHNDPGADLISAVSTHMAADSALCRTPAADPNFGVAAVHRLDRETSGVVLLAARADVLRYFADQFAAHTAAKRYTALVHGLLGRPGEIGEWTWPVSKGAAGRSHPAGSGAKVPSTTRYRVVAHGNRYSLVRCEPVTGRRHQIRRHAKLAGHPVVGDRRYGTKRSVAYLADRYGFSRLGLHADRLTVRILETGKQRVIRSRGLPADMDRLFASDSAAIAH